MIIEVGPETSPEQLTAAADIAWEIYTKPESSCFPRRESKKQLRAEFQRAAKQRDDKLLALYEGDTLTGLFNLFVEKKNRYLQSNGLYLQTNFAGGCAAFLDYAREKYPGYEILLGFPPENKAASTFMASYGAERIESSVVTRLTKNEYNGQTTEINIQPVTLENFGLFAAFHDAVNPDLYWTAARIREKFDGWINYIAMKEGHVTGSISVSVWDKVQAEIFSLSAGEDLLCEADKQKISLALLSGAMPAVFACNRQNVLYFIDEEDESALKAAAAVGFKTIDRYQCYKINF